MVRGVNKEAIDDKKISIAIMSSYAILTIQYLVLVYFNLIDTSSGQIIQIISKGLVGILYLLALPVVLERNKIKFIGVYFIWVVIFLFNFIVFNENWIYLRSIIFSFFFTCLPSFIYAYSINCWDVLIDVMKKTSKLVLTVGTLIGILVFTGNASVGAYSMGLSYYMLLPTIIYMNEFLDKISLKPGLIILLSMMIILSLGSRGAILCVGIFIILKFIGLSRGISYKRILLFIILLTIIILGLIFIDDILEYIYNFLLDFGIESRSIRLFLRDGIYLSNRDKLYEVIVEEILDNPFLGIGLAGDRAIINTYTHNIFIEILSNFGIVVGAFLILGMIYLIIRSLFIKNIYEYNMVIIWISIGFVHLFLSSSYLIDFKFWTLLGLLLRNTNKDNLAK